MAAVWTDEVKAEMTDLYIENMQKLDNDGSKSMIIVDQLREEYADKGQAFTANAIRMMLMKQKRPTEENPEGKVYIPKPTSSGSTTTSSAGTARVSKADAQAALRAAISAIDPALVDEDLVTKSTGKAAQYFTGLIIAAQGA